jgi:tetratricopeptide (TPR) repeat protein
MHLSTSIALALALTAGQTVADVRQLYDAGKYRDVVGAVDQATDADKASRLQYLAAQSYDKLSDPDAARRAYQRLADMGGDTPWALIGRSAVQLMDQQLDEALGSADQAASLDASLPEAPYQRGIVLMSRKDYGGAMDAFTKAAQLDPAFAAAHYYAGLASYRVKRIDLMTDHFESFIKLAPNAPERSEVESILRTVRGR